MADSNGVVCLSPLSKKQRIYINYSINYLEVLNILI